MLFKRTNTILFIYRRESLSNCQASKTASKINPAADWAWDRTRMYKMICRSLELQADWHPSRERFEEITIAKHKKIRTTRKNWWNMTHQFCQLIDLIDKQSAYTLTWPGNHLSQRIPRTACWRMSLCMVSASFNLLGAANWAWWCWVVCQEKIPLHEGSYMLEPRWTSWLYA